ncbi:hypothetical protein F4810DRAFT_717921 [Camillea tinctor]|nr:hypothetical protein F4810DRAFT_717921 [Camillea tinctor]
MTDFRLCNVKTHISHSFILLPSSQVCTLMLFLMPGPPIIGKRLGGVVWEEDPVRHRKVTRKLVPVFSLRTIRTMKPVIHKYRNHFVARMKEIGATPKGIAS